MTGSAIDADAPHRVVIVAFDGVQSLDVTGPAEVFAGADAVLTAAGRPGYQITIASPAGGVVTTESPVRLHTDYRADGAGDAGRPRTLPGRRR